MSGWTLISQAFGEGANLYTDVLGLPSDTLSDEGSSSITASQLRKAYYKRALEFHPDKQMSSTPQETEISKLKFQAISLAYTILSDPEKKREYDEAGHVWDEDEIGSSSSDQGFDMWSEYFRGIFGVVTTKDIDTFTLQYKCSEEEQNDVLNYYTKFKGNLNKMLECVMCSSDIDKRRWVDDYITPAVKNGTVADYMKEIQKTLGVVHDDDNDDCGGDTDDEDFDEEMTESDEDDDAQKQRKHAKAKTMPPRKNAVKAISKKKKKKSPTKNSKPKRSNQGSGGVPTDLIAAIQGKSVSRREEAFGKLMSGLEAKYGGKSTANGNKSDFIPDDEFEAIRSKLDANRKGGLKQRR